MKSRARCLFASFLAFAMTQVSHGAAITWNAASTISADTDVFNVGLAKYAYDGYNASQIVNGVTFLGSGVASGAPTSWGSGDISLSGFTNTNTTTYSTPTGISTAYGYLTKGATYGGTSAATITLNNLTSGHVYATQIWVNDSRTAGSGRTETVTSSGGNSVVLDFNSTETTGGAGQYTIGGFTASGTTQAFTLTGSASSQLNAIQVRDVTGVWSGAASGSWADGAANFTGGSTWSTASGLIGGSGVVYFADTDGFRNTITNNTVSIQSSGISTGTITFQNNSVDYTINNASGTTGIAGSSAIAISKTGSGKVTLGGANTFSGATIINAGTLVVADAAGLGAAGTYGRRTIINTGGTLELATDTSVANEFLDITSNNTASVVVNRATSGVGITQSLGATYLGSASVLNVTKGSNVTSGTATLETSQIYLVSNSVGTSTLNADTAAISVTGSVSNYVASNKTLELAGSSLDSAISGVISDGAGSNGTVSLTKSGAGTWKLSNDNTYSGATLVTGGVLKIQHSNALGTTAGTTTISTGAKLQLDGSNLNIAENLAVGTSNSGATIENLSGNNTLSGTLTRNGVLNLVSTAGSLTVNSGIGDTNNSVNLSGAGDGEIAGNITLAYALTKSDNGTWTLSGTNTYIGATSVTGGTLVIGSTGSLAAASAVTVSNSGTELVVDGTVNGTLVANSSTSLSGSGTISGAAEIQGIHNPGNSPGIQTFGSNLSYTGGASVVNWELGLNTATQGDPTAVFDQIIVGGNLNFTNSTTLNLVFNGTGSGVLWSDTFWDSDQSWTLYDVAGSTSNFSNLQLTTINWLDSTGTNSFETARPDASFSLSLSGNDVLLNYTAVPEPRAALLGGIGLLMLLRRRR